MRVVMYGVGAIGGVVAGGLVRAGREVLGIARGARLQALQEKGLTLRWPDGTETVPVPCVGSPAEVDWREDDAILLGMKSQHTEAALQDLRAAGVWAQPIFCAQNGVANEAMALRVFPNVHGITVMLPAAYMALDEAVAYCAPRFGVFDIGRYPSGHDAADAQLAEVLTAGGILGCVSEDVMTQKYGKLILNLNNIVEAALGREADTRDITEALRAEGREVLRHAGITFADVGAEDPRRAEMQVRPVDGAARLGGSSTQSLLRGADSIETDYLNGEIALIARRNGVEAPLNAAATRVAADLVRRGGQPGDMSPDAFRARIGMAPAGD